MTTTLTASSFEEAIGRTGILVIDWWAPWCAPCRAFGPIFEDASRRHPDATWAKVDTDAEGALAGALGIRSIPTLMVFRDGILVFERPGVLPGQALDSLLDRVRSLDMDDVRRHLGDRASASADAGGA